MTTNLTIGERVAWYRRRRGMSQEVLAGLVGRTVDWLSKAENNRLELDRLSVIKSLADALDVTLGDLLAEPTLLEWTSDSGTRTVPALRSALMNYRQLTPLLGVTTEGEPTPLNELRGSVAEVWDAYQDSRYGFATRRLPLLLADALIAAQAYEGRDREQAYELMAMTYQGAAMVLTKLGETDLAWIAADRGLAAAQQSGNATVTGSLFRSVAHCLLSNGRFDAAVQLVGDAGEYLRSGLDAATPEFLSIYGTLYLAGSMAAARAEDRGTTQTFLGGSGSGGAATRWRCQPRVDSLRPDERRHSPSGHCRRAGRHAGRVGLGPADRHPRASDRAADSPQPRSGPSAQHPQPRG
ncbi:helix-turn-helix domain-containing protein [Streptomyces mirabilis]|uniref:helix-turn-helix domain-containing protein n=1 Tax=Streptomyces sp. NPDC005388 TaxID=3156717 RepID=UPI0033A38C94